MSIKLIQNLALIFSYYVVRLRATCPQRLRFINTTMDKPLDEMFTLNFYSAK